MRGTVRARQKGQSLVEFAVISVVLMLLLLGASDLARGFYLSVEISGASRAGMRAAVLINSANIGDAVRSEPNTAIPNTSSTWGATGPGGTYDHCDSTSGACGDPTGCATSVFSGARLACFAVRPCVVQSSAGNPLACASYGSWGQRPASGSGNGIQVLVVYAFTPTTPAIARFAGGTNGVFYLKSTTTGAAEY